MAVIIPAFIPRTGVDRYTQQQIIDAVPQPLGINSPGVSGLDDGWKSVYIENPEYKKARGGGGGSSPLSPEAEPVDEKGRPIPKFIQFRKGDPKNNGPKDFNKESGVIMNTAPVQIFNADGTPIKQPNAFQRLDDMYVVDTTPTTGNNPIPQVVGREELPYITGEKTIKPGEKLKEIGSGAQNVSSIMSSEDYVKADNTYKLRDQLQAQLKPGEQMAVEVYSKEKTEAARLRAREKWNEQNSQMQIAQAKLMMENPGIYGTPEQIAARDAEIAKSGLGDVPTTSPDGRPIPAAIRAQMKPGDSYEKARIIRGSTGAPPRLQPLPTLGMTPYEEPGPQYDTITLNKEKPAYIPRGPQDKNPMFILGADGRQSTLGNSGGNSITAGGLSVKSSALQNGVVAESVSENIANIVRHNFSNPEAAKGVLFGDRSAKDRRSYTEQLDGLRSALFNRLYNDDKDPKKQNFKSYFPGYNYKGQLTGEATTGGIEATGAKMTQILQSMRGIGSLNGFTDQQKKSVWDAYCDNYGVDQATRNQVKLGDDPTRFFAAMNQERLKYAQAGRNKDVNDIDPNTFVDGNLAALLSYLQATDLKYLESKVSKGGKKP